MSDKEKALEALDYIEESIKHEGIDYDAEIEWIKTIRAALQDKPVCDLESLKQEYIKQSGNTGAGLNIFDWLNERGHLITKEKIDMVHESEHAIKAMLAEVQELRKKVKAQEWQPIETIPDEYKDNETEVLAFIGSVDIIYWSYGNWWSESAENDVIPTHWMPLPAQPKQDGKK